MTAVAGADFLVADDPAEFATRIVDLLENSGRRETVGWNGRRFVETHHDWREIAVRLEEIYASLAVPAAA